MPSSPVWTSRLPKYFCFFEMHASWHASWNARMPIIAYIITVVSLILWRQQRFLTLSQEKNRIWVGGLTVGDCECCQQLQTDHLPSCIQCLLGRACHKWAWPDICVFLTTHVRKRRLQAYANRRLHKDIEGYPQAQDCHQKRFLPNRV